MIVAREAPKKCPTCGNAELVQDGLTGLLVPPGDDEALYAALKQVEQDPAAAHERAVRAQELSKKFSPEAMLASSAELFKSL